MLQDGMRQDSVTAIAAFHLSTMQLSGRGSFEPPFSNDV